MRHTYPTFRHRKKQPVTDIWTTPIINGSGADEGCMAPEAMEQEYVDFVASLDAVFDLTLREGP